jgi:hypothetical protein
MLQFCGAQNVWDTPAQAFAMQTLAWFHSDVTDTATVSFGYLARMTGLDRRYVMRVMEQLELEKEGCVNLGADPLTPQGANRWSVTIDKAVAKARAQAGIVDRQRLPKRRTRATVVIPGPPEETAKAAGDGRDSKFSTGGGGLWTTRVVAPGPPPGDPRITGVVAPGSPQSAQLERISNLERVEPQPRDAAAAASPPLEFSLIGEVPPTTKTAAEAKHARAERESRLFDKVKKVARWALEHPVEATALNGGAGVASDSDLAAVVRARCREQRIIGANEGDALVNACRSEWYLGRTYRTAMAATGEPPPRPRDLRRDKARVTTRGTLRKGAAG